MYTRGSWLHVELWLHGRTVHWPQTLLAGGEGLPGRTPSPAKVGQSEQAGDHAATLTQAEKHQVAQVEQWAEQLGGWLHIWDQWFGKPLAR